jgi:hypothetical protein
MTLGHGTLSLYCNVANFDFFGRRMDELAQYTTFKLHMHVAFLFIYLFFFIGLKMTTMEKELV